MAGKKAKNSLNKWSVLSGSVGTIDEHLPSADNRAALRATVRNSRLRRTSFEYMVERIRAIQAFKHKAAGSPLFYQNYQDGAVHGGLFVVGRKRPIDPNSQHENAGRDNDEVFILDLNLYKHSLMEERNRHSAIPQGLVVQPEARFRESQEVKYIRPVNRWTHKHLDRVVLSNLADIVTSHPDLTWYLVLTTGGSGNDKWHHAEKKVFGPPYYDLLMKPYERPLTRR